jgi:hypothetical protein
VLRMRWLKVLRGMGVRRVVGRKLHEGSREVRALEEAEEGRREEEVVLLLLLLLLVGLDKDVVRAVVSLRRRRRREVEGIDLIMDMFRILLVDYTVDVYPAGF